MSGGSVPIVLFSTKVEGTINELSSGNQFAQAAQVRRIGDVKQCPVIVRPQIELGGVRNAAAGNTLSPGAIFATGAGLLTPTPQDGEIIVGTLPEPAQAVEVMVGLDRPEVLYTGSAPQFVAGLLQVNIRIPSNPQELGVVRWC